MGSIYSNSACAFIWLGPGDENSDGPLSLIDTLENLPKDMASPFDDQACAKLEALLSRPWHNRTWTFQEPIRAPERMIACGSGIRDWNTIVRALRGAMYFRCRQETLASISLFLTIDTSISQKAEDLRLSDLLFRTCGRNASDPRDKVYALYGLVQDHQKVPLEISYAMSVEDVYRSTVRFCIQNERTLSILTYVSANGSQSDLPSWVPDWRDGYGSGRACVDAKYLTKFNASSMSRPVLVPSSSNDKLILKGFVLATIERTIDIAALKFNAADSFPESWITNAAAAGVPARFLQGKTFRTSYDLTMTMEHSPFYSEFERSTDLLWANSVSWTAAGQPDPIPQAVLTEYKEGIDAETLERRMILTKDSLGLAPEPTEVGDKVCILLGGNEPFILRSRQKPAKTTPRKNAKVKHQSMWKIIRQNIANSVQHGSKERARVAKQALEATEWTLIGDCYLHGYMHGEAMETVTEADYVNFTLV